MTRECSQGGNILELDFISRTLNDHNIAIEDGTSDQRLVLHAGFHIVLEVSAVTLWYKLKEVVLRCINNFVPT